MRLLNYVKWSLLLWLIPFLGQGATQPTVHSFTLSNGLTVILNEDHSKPEIFGMVVVRAGGKEDPKDATGMAHYMEHMLFKGSQRLGTTDWEAEKPHLDKIAELYNKLRQTQDPKEKETIRKEINQESIKAGEYGIPNEFSDVVKNMGGSSINASTGWDRTQFFNAFPPYQLEKWLILQADRFSNPVFRGFQAELEVVYEERNRAYDGFVTPLLEAFSKQMYGDHPYGKQTLIGTADHLKNPSLTKMYKFLHDWYVPNNMALILSGDINPEKAKPLIEKTFSTWKRKEIPERNKPVSFNLKGRNFQKMRISPFNLGIWGFPAFAQGHQDEISLEICCELLTNSNQTGILDPLVFDNQANSIDVSPDLRLDGGCVQIVAIPAMDISQMRQGSISSIEKEILKGISKLKKGDFPDWKLDAVKKQMLQLWERQMESPENRGFLLTSLFLEGAKADELYTRKEKIEAVKKEDIIRVAEKIFTKNFLAIHSYKGKPSIDRLKKPGFDPVKPKPGRHSEMATTLEKIPVVQAKEEFIDLNKAVAKKSIRQGVTLYYTPNPQNEVFTLTLRFGAGSNSYPRLNYATDLMNYAGILNQMKIQEVKEAFAKMHCKYDFFNSSRYTYVTLQGDEKNLGAACQLLTRIMLMPDIDNQQLNAVIGGELNQREMENSEVDIVADALNDYMIYDSHSPYLERLSESELKEITASALSKVFSEASAHEAEIHYCGTLSMEQVASTIQGNLAFQSVLQPARIKDQRPMKSYKKPVIYLVDWKDAAQSNIFFYNLGDSFTCKQEALYDAFNQYFSGGFSGLVLQEIREYRSMAYTAAANFDTPPINGQNVTFNGYIGTQADKTNDAIEVFLSLVREMPNKPERIETVKNNLKQAQLAKKPHFRYLSRQIVDWKNQGFSQDPAKEKIPEWKEMDYNDIEVFYKEHLQKIPMAIAIVGDTREIDIEKLKKIAKVIEVKEKKLFTN